MSARTVAVHPYLGSGLGASLIGPGTSAVNTTATRLGGANWNLAWALMTASPSTSTSGRLDLNYRLHIGLHVDDHSQRRADHRQSPPGAGQLG
jgi:hypothetical protein